MAFVFRTQTERNRCRPTIHEGAAALQLSLFHHKTRRALSRDLEAREHPKFPSKGTDLQHPGRPQNHTNHTNPFPKSPGPAAGPNQHARMGQAVFRLIYHKSFKEGERFQAFHPLLLPHFIPYHSTRQHRVPQPNTTRPASIVGTGRDAEGTGRPSARAQARGQVRLERHRRCKSHPNLRAEKRTARTLTSSKQSSFFGPSPACHNRIHPAYAWAMSFQRDE